MRRTSPGALSAGIAATMLLLLAGFAVALATDGADDHEVIGRFSVEADVGGAVWAFQPGGLLVLMGPGDISAEGTWTAATAEREFDATVDYAIAGQALQVQGEVSPDGSRIAVYITASEATKPEDADPWPAESRLIGERLGMISEPTPTPSAAPLDCMRPDWVDGLVDWDRCDDAPLIEA